jgi:hypothetical protein
VSVVTATKPKARHAARAVDTGTITPIPVAAEAGRSYLKGACPRLARMPRSARFGL